MELYITANEARALSDELNRNESDEARAIVKELFATIQIAVLTSNERRISFSCGENVRKDVVDIMETFGYAVTSVDDVNGFLTISWES